MGKVILFLLMVLILGSYLYLSRPYWFYSPTTSAMSVDKIGYQESPSKLLKEAKEFLKARKDSAALTNFAKVLATAPNDINALWGKAEILRRARKYTEAKEILEQILRNNPKHAPSILTLAFIQYLEGKLNDAQKTLKGVFENSTDKENHAMAFMIIGAINAKRAESGFILSKLKNATQIRCYFERAKELAPDVPEIRLALGTFYMNAPAVLGGNMERALTELTAAVEMAPDFATANARLAQYYRKKGDFQKYTRYIERAEYLDPGSDIIAEVKNQDPFR